MKVLYMLLIGALCGAAFADMVETDDAAPVAADSRAVESDRTARAMGDDDDFSDDFDEFIRYFQRGIMKFFNKMTGLQERQSLGDFSLPTFNQIQRGIRRFINRMSSPEERQTALTSTIPFIGRLIFRSLSYLGSFLVGALAVPPLLAGNALSLFGLYRPNEPNELISQPVLPNFFGNQQQQHTDRVSSSGSQQVNDLSEALFLLGQRNQAVQQDSGQAEALLAQAAGSSSPVEISEIVNDLIRVQSNNRPASLWDRLTRGLSVFLPQVSRQVTPAGAVSSLLVLGSLIGAPYFLNRRSDSGLGEDFTNDEPADSFENYYLQPPRENFGASEYETGNKKNGRKNGEAAYGANHNSAYSADQSYQAGEHNEVYQQPAAAAANAPYNPYQYVNRRSGETKSEIKAEAPAA